MNDGSVQCFVENGIGTSNRQQFGGEAREETAMSGKSNIVFQIVTISNMASTHIYILLFSLLFLLSLLLLLLIVIVILIIIHSYIYLSSPLDDVHVVSTIYYIYILSNGPHLLTSFKFPRTYKSYKAELGRSQEFSSWTVKYIAPESTGLYPKVTDHCPRPVPKWDDLPNRFKSY